MESTVSCFCSFKADSSLTRPFVALLETSHSDFFEATGRDHQPVAFLLFDVSCLKGSHIFGYESFYFRHYAA